LTHFVGGSNLYNSGQLPKFKYNLYKDYEEDFYLIPTAEVPITSFHSNEFVDGKLPLSYCAYTPCFRREKMSAGKDVRGMKRGHQFDKVELYKFVDPETSAAELDKMVAYTEKVCLDLELPYRILKLSTVD
jgi:seryl-tRNA synthetase